MNKEPIEEIEELGYPKSIVRRLQKPTSELIDTEDLRKELNEILYYHCDRILTADWIKLTDSLK